MKKDICKKIDRLINTKYKDIFYAINYDYYVHVLRVSTDNLLMVIHGHGSYTNPYEVKLIKVDDDKAVNKQFESEKAMLDYLNNDILDDLMVYEL